MLARRKYLGAVVQAYSAKTLTGPLHAEGANKPAPI